MHRIEVKVVPMHPSTNVPVATTDQGRYPSPSAMKKIVKHQCASRINRKCATNCTSKCMQPKYSKAKEQDQEEKCVTNYTQLKSEGVVLPIDLGKESVNRIDTLL